MRKLGKKFPFKKRKYFPEVDKIKKLSVEALPGTPSDRQLGTVLTRVQGNHNSSRSLVKTLKGFGFDSSIRYKGLGLIQVLQLLDSLQLRVLYCYRD